MIILGIDPGSRSTGFGIIEKSGNRFKYLHSGVFNFEKEGTFLNRMGPAYFQLKQLIEEFKPESAAIESLIHVKNVSSLAKLAQMRGALIAAILNYMGNDICEYAPNLIKSAVTGHGHASKEMVDRAVSIFLGIQNFKKSDESDALAIALCHGLRQGLTKSKIIRSMRDLR